jgi:hypothetical protein
MDQPQSSQSSFSDPSATAGPVPLFDIHLRYLTDSYLTFFQERQVLALIYLIEILTLRQEAYRGDIVGAFLLSGGCVLNSLTVLSRSGDSIARLNLQTDFLTKRAT